MKDIQTVAMIGRGAVGSIYAKIIVDNIGYDNICFIADEMRVKKYKKEGLIINGIPYHFQYISDIKEFKAVDLIIISTKFSGLESLINLIKDFVKDDTIIISTINGIVSEDILREHFPNNSVIRCIAQGMDSSYFNNKVNYTHTGQLIVGAEFEKEKNDLNKLIRFFDKVSIPYTNHKDIVHAAWSKLMLNCGINQVCAAYDVPYGGVQQDGPLRNIFIDTMKEVQSVAREMNIILTDNEIQDWVDLMDSLDPNGMPSMRQDIIAKRKTEIELFSGTIIPLAKKYGVDVVNLKNLYHRIIELEQNF